MKSGRMNSPKIHSNIREWGDYLAKRKQKKIKSAAMLFCSEADKCFHQALADFEAARYREAFLQFVELYNNGYEQEGIFNILTEAFYDPNKKELQECYEKNCKHLAQYPYIWCEFPDFDALPVRLYPLSDTEYYEFDVKTREFKSLYSPMKEDERPYFFQQLDKPLFIESERNFYNLKYLNDTVRRSEDFAGDNHIYLFYDSFDEVSNLMQACDLNSLLAMQKFVFLIGEAQRQKYPIDFAKEFTIDYRVMTPQLLRIEEMNRLCYWYKRGYTGTLFALSVLNQNPYIIMRFGFDLHERSYIQGHPLFLTNVLENILKDTQRKYKPADIRNAYNHPEIDLNWPDCLDFVHWLEQTQNGRLEFTVPELFRAYFIYSFHKEKPKENPRVVPVILWEPHLNWKEEYDPITLGFPYRIVLNSMRDPIVMIGRTYESEGSIWLYGEYALAHNMNPELRKQYYAYRFEDLKMYPETTCRALCQLLNVPYTSNMLQSNYSYNAPGGDTVTGFDMAPLHRNVGLALSQFDQVRLRIFFDPILRHYGYETFDFDECPMSDQDIAYLLKFPFRFERGYVESGKWEKVSAEQLRQRLFQNMLAYWQLGKKGDIVLPRVIRPNDLQTEGGIK